MTNKLKLNVDVNVKKKKPNQLLIHNINKQYTYTKITMPMFPQDTSFEEWFMSNGASYNYIHPTEHTETTNHNGLNVMKKTLVIQT